jgi:DNA repair exonuclease SbcCD ATPase subunit
VVTKVTTPYKQMLARADAELAALAKAHEETQARIIVIDAELASIAARAEARRVQVHTAQQTRNELENAFRQAQAQATLAEGTVGAWQELAPLSQQEKQAQKAEQDLAKLLQRTEAERAKDEARAATLRNERVASEKRLGEIQQQRSAMEAARRKTHAEQGEAEYTDSVVQLDLLKAQLAARQKALESAEQELDSFATEALQRLLPWIDLQRKIKPQLPYSDASTRVVDAAITLFNALINGGNASDVHPDIMRAAGLQWDTLAGLLTTEVQFLWPALNGQRPDMLIDKCERLRKVRRAIHDVKR